MLSPMFIQQYDFSEVALLPNMAPGEDGQMADQHLDVLGKYFARAQIGKRYGITFEVFVEKVTSGAWAAMHEINFNSRRCPVESKNN